MLLPVPGFWRRRLISRSNLRLWRGVNWPSGAILAMAGGISLILAIPLRKRKHDGEAAPVFARFVVRFAVQGQPGVAGDFAVRLAVYEASAEVDLEGQPCPAEEVVAGQGAAQAEAEGGAAVEEDGQVGEVAVDFFGLGGRPFGG